MKKYMNAALTYAILAMVGGVFYREFTKFMGFTAKTALSVIHSHYFMLGMVFFLLLLLLEKSFAFTNEKTGRVLLAYHIGLNLAALMLYVRGITQVLNAPPNPRRQRLPLRHRRSSAYSARREPSGGVAAS